MNILIWAYVNLFSGKGQRISESFAEEHDLSNKSIVWNLWGYKKKQSDYHIYAFATKSHHYMVWGFTAKIFKDLFVKNRILK